MGRKAEVNLRINESRHQVLSISIDDSLDTFFERHPGNGLSIFTADSAKLAQRAVDVEYCPGAASRS